MRRKNTPSAAPKGVSCFPGHIRSWTIVAKLFLVFNFYLFGVEIPGHAAILAPYPLISMTNQLWKYNQSGTNLGSAWRIPTFDDSTWSDGRGVFAYETDNALVLSQTNAILARDNAGASIITYYFRTHFTVTNNPTAIQLAITNLVDDGAVYYLNGVEVSRQNMLPAPEKINYLTTASSAVEAAYNATIWTGFQPNLGDNVLAVEVHQASSTSSDIVFGLAATAVFLTPTPLIITNQPSNQLVHEGCDTTMPFGVAGAPIDVQWYKGGIPIPGANAVNLSLNNVSLADEAFYFAVATNSLTVVTSKTVSVTVLPDVTPPQPTVADGTFDLSTVVVTWSEPVAPQTATNVTNYAITNMAGATLSIYEAKLLSNSVVVLTTSSRAPDDNYILVASGVRDISSRSNVQTAATALPVVVQMSLVNFFSTYSFYNPYPPFNNPEPPAGWQLPGFTPPDSWGSNENEPGAFWAGNGTLPLPKGKELSSGPALANYFITTFDYYGSLLDAELSLRYLVDAGAVFYLNGAEVLRLNLPSGPVTPSTSALQRVRFLEVSDYVSIPAHSLKIGQNTLATELHSLNPYPTNVAFATELRAQVASFARGPLLILQSPQNQTVFEGETARLAFMAVGPSNFQWFRNGAAIPGATNAQLFLPSASLSLDGSEFSVRAENETGSVLSDTARLTVLPDLNPPKLLSVIAFETNLLRVTFSKPVDRTTATNAANYALTNVSGSNPAILGVSWVNDSNTLLQVTQPLSDETVLGVKNVQDTSSRKNPVPPGSAATIGWRISVPIDTDWKYDQSGRDLGTSWRNANYNDSAWSNGASLFYIEDAPLPAPKNTLLSGVFGPIFITNYYFRKAFVAPITSTNATIAFRHVIDDGVILYCNSGEFHRSNMTTGIVTFNTFANTSVGDAVYSQVLFQKLTNIVSGTNVFAAELHQSSPVSSDVVFGLEYTIDIPSVLLPIAPAPSLHLSSGSQGYLYWLTNGVVLEETSTLPSAQWLPVRDQTNPYPFNPTNTSRFFRLRE